jgi:hypothetical protein
VYWKSSQIQSQPPVHLQSRSQNTSRPNLEAVAKSKAKPASRPKPTKIHDSLMKARSGRGFVVEDSDDEPNQSGEEVDLDVDLSRLSKEQSKPRLFQISKRSQASGSEQNNPLFLASDQDDLEVDDDLLSEREFDNATNGETTTLTSHEPSVGRAKPSASKTRGRYGNPIILDDDSDDGAFKGFKSRRRR